VLVDVWSGVVVVPEVELVACAKAIAAANVTTIKITRSFFIYATPVQAQVRCPGAFYVSSEVFRSESSLRGWPDLKSPAALASYPGAPIHRE
jgi:hypothetical protein